MESYADVGCVLKINVQCEACKLKVYEVLRSVSGVYTVTIDADEGLVKISGEVEPNILLSALGRSGKHAELKWVKLKSPAPPPRRDSYHYDGYNNYGSYNNYSTPISYYGHNGNGGYRAVEQLPPYGQSSRSWTLPDYSSGSHQRYRPMPAVPEYSSGYSATSGYGYPSPRGSARYSHDYPNPCCSRH